MVDDLEAALEQSREIAMDLTWVTRSQRKIESLRNFELL
jgi:hypothetical protein